jgi:hypothetical protein
MGDNTNPLRDTVMAEIATHLKVHGPKDWHLIRDRYPAELGGPTGSVGERKFYRWVKRVQDGILPGAKAEAIKKAKSAVSRNLPATPPPEYITRRGAAATRNIDFLTTLSEVVGDIELMREYSSEMKDGARKIKNPMYFDISIKRRLDVMETAIRIMQEVWDLERMEGFYYEIIDIISSEILPIEPAIAKRIMTRLQALNDKRAMTVHANAPAGPDVF